MIITVNEFQNNLEKYLEVANTECVYITQNGKISHVIDSITSSQVKINALKRMSNSINGYEHLLDEEVIEIVNSSKEDRDGK